MIKRYFSKRLTTAFLAIALACTLSVPCRAQASNLVTQSIFALLGASSAFSEPRLIWVAQQCKPGISPSTVRAAHLGTMVSAMAAGNIWSWYEQPNSRPDYERLGWNVGEFLLGYFAAHLYIQ